MNRPRKGFVRNLSKTLNATENSRRFFVDIGIDLLNRLDWIDWQPKIVLDVGCRDGKLTSQLRQRFPKALVVGCDLNFPLLCKAKKTSANHDLTWVCADASGLPFPTQSVDFIFCHLSLIWLESIPDVMAEFARVLNPQGLLLLSTFADRSFIELKQCWQQVSDRSHVADFLTFSQCAELLTRYGFVEPVLDIQRFQLAYPNSSLMFRDLQSQGFTYRAASDHRGLLGKSHWQQFLQVLEQHRDNEGLLPLTLELLTAHAWAPKILARGARANAQGEVIIPFESLVK